MRRITFAALAMLLVIAVAQPVEAACAAEQLVASNGGGGTQQSFMWNPAFTGPATYFTGYPPLFYTVPPFSPALNISWWSVGDGDPQIGPGNDSGAYDPANEGGFYYSTNPGYGIFYAGELFGTQTGATVDGCADPSTCLCVLIVDQDGMDAQYAIVATQLTPGGDGFINLSGMDGSGNGAGIQLAAVPGPAITNSVRRPNFDVEVTLTVADAGVGVYNGASAGACADACNPIGYRIRQQILDRGEQPPSDRDKGGWALPNDVNDQPQGVAAFGTPTTILSACGSSETQLYLATELVFPGSETAVDFAASVVSSNSNRMECGPNLADPNPRGEKPKRGDPVGKPKPRRR